MEKLIINVNKIPELKIYQKSSRTYEFQATDEFNRVLDLTGTTISFKAFLDIGGQTTTTVLTSVGVITDTVKGLFKISLNDNDTNIDNLLYSYRIEILYNTGNTLIFGNGKLEVIGDDTSNISRIKQKYGFTYPYDILSAAWEYAKTNTLNKGFFEENITINSPTDLILIDNYVADRNFDNIVDKTDIKIIEYQSNPPYDVIDVSTNISSFVADHPTGKSIIHLSTKTPSDPSFTTKLTYSRMIDAFDNLKPSILALQERFFIQYLFSTLEPYKLQQGMTSKSLNGVDITFDQSAIRDYQHKLTDEISAFILNIQGFGFNNNMTSVQMDKRYKR